MLKLKVLSLVLLATVSTALTGAASPAAAATASPAEPQYDCGDNFVCLWENTTFRGFQISQGEGRGFCIEEVSYQSAINHLPIPVTLWRNPDCTGPSQTLQPNTANPNLGAFYYGVTM